MSVERRPPSLESNSLLVERPPSYHSTDDVNGPPSPTYSEPGPPPINEFSKADVCWILAGLWSGVLLGAFDGKDIDQFVKGNPPNSIRYRCCNSANTDWE